MPDDADGQSFMGMSAKRVLPIARMQEFNVPQIVGTPEFGLFAVEQLLFAAVQAVPRLTRLASDDDATSTPERIALPHQKTPNFRIHLPRLTVARRFVSDPFPSPPRKPME